MLPFATDSTDNKDFHLEIEFEESKNVFTVVNIKRMGIFELVGLSFAIIVGLIVLARIMKSFIGEYEYFKSIDREAVMLFGQTGNTAVDEKFDRDARALDER